MAGSLDEISTAIGELRGQVTEVLRMYVRTEARLEQMAKDLTQQIAETRDSWHRRANETQGLLGKIELELLQIKIDYKQVLHDQNKQEERITAVEKDRRLAKGEIRISAAALGTLAAALVEGLIQLWKVVHGAG